MQGSMLAVLPFEWEDWIFEGSWAFRDAPKGLLGLAWVKETYRKMRSQPVVELVFIDGETGESIHSDSFQ